MANPTPRAPNLAILKNLRNYSNGFGRTEITTEISYDNDTSYTTEISFNNDTSYNDDYKVYKEDDQVYVGLLVLLCLASIPPTAFLVIYILR